MENKKPQEKPKEKCVILGGVHGDDKLGVEILTQFFKQPNPLFQLMLGNYKAVERGVKFVDFDLLKAGEGDITCETSIEKCRAGEIHEVLGQFDYVVDIHGSHVNNDLLIITNTETETLDFARALGVSRAILIPKNNYLIESVRHNVTLVKRVEAKPSPRPDEIAETLLALNRLESYFAGTLPAQTRLDVFELSLEKENTIDFIKENDITPYLKPHITQGGE